MNIVYPIKLDTAVTISGSGRSSRSQSTIDATDLKSPGTFSSTSGYDSSVENGGRGVRLTNLVGILNGDMLRNCPHCKKDKPQQNFGNTRTTNEVRDQSNCIDCRAVAAI